MKALGRVVGLLVFFARDGGNAAGVLQCALEGVVGILIELLDILALDIDLASLAEHARQPCTIDAV